MYTHVYIYTWRRQPFIGIGDKTAGWLLLKCWILPSHILCTLKGSLLSLDHTTIISFLPYPLESLTMSDFRFRLNHAHISTYLLTYSLEEKQGRCGADRYKYSGLGWRLERVENAEGIVFHREGRLTYCFSDFKHNSQVTYIYIYIVRISMRLDRWFWPLLRWTANTYISRDRERQTTPGNWAAGKSKCCSRREMDFQSNKLHILYNMYI